MKRFTKVRRILALSLVLAMAFGGTVFASDSNTALVNDTYQQLTIMLNKEMAWQKVIQGSLCHRLIRYGY